MAYWMFVKKDMFLDLSFKNFNYRSSMVYDTLYVAVPSTLENILISAFGVVVNNMLAIVDGTSAVAIYTAALRMSQVSQIPLSGISTALLTVSGVSYGASNPENLNVAYSYSIKFGLAISTVIAVLMVIFSPQLASVFAYSTASASLLPDISTAISILTLYLFVIPMGVMSSMMFQGVGKGLYSLLIGFMRFLLLGSIFSYTCSALCSDGELQEYMPVRYSVVLLEEYVLSSWQNHSFTNSKRFQEKMKLFKDYTLKTDKNTTE